MPSTTITFLGTDSVAPIAGEDTASLLINRTILVDTGWCSALRLLDHGLSPVDLRYVLFTHLHHDHYIGLPHLIFYRWMKLRNDPNVWPLTLIGPAADLALVVQLAKDFLQLERFDHRPVLELRPLEPGDGFEGEGFRLRTCPSIHPVQGLCYRFEDQASGASVAISGDTAYQPLLAELARGADLLIHEASHGAAPQRENPNQHGHSGSPDAATIAQAAGVRRLAIVHGASNLRENALAAAQAIFPNTFWPAVGETVDVSPG